ncbi:LuxR C-terminal-related transcriptional regulator [Chryseobacterium potabilaquae]|uniref:Oxygen regulatory protein NreC n=1 Tax=Chryseobacterium potabilaquae TaxID=2675057 RepID=A0A6N4X1E4_9FLAO|nr:response regulator transcription factor [Chryseobacterium potabilaquae]CAA7194064.1 Oxygen regulatory protein NreC [Chryseobacterium potabilaquae]
MNKILIADHHYVTVKGITSILKCINPDIAVEHVIDKESLLEKITYNQYDLLILEIKIFSNIFAPIIRELKGLNPDLKIMVFTESNEDLIIPYLCGGAQAYLYKSATKEQLREALQSIFSMGFYYQQELFHDLIHKMKGGNMHPYTSLERLSEREREVFYYLVEGNGMLEIANLLQIHQSTASIYKKHIFEKLQINSLAELINFHNKHKVYMSHGNEFE